MNRPANIFLSGFACCVFLSILMAPLSAQAEQTPFIEIAPDSQIRLITSGQVDDRGQMSAALDIRMPQTTTTYWRVPGETGIPMQLSTANSRGIDSLKLKWPLPHRKNVGGYLDHVYRGNVIIPMMIDVETTTPWLELDILMGVCDEICVPVNMTLQTQLKIDTPDPVSALTIRQAETLVPQTWPDDLPILNPPLFDPQSGVVRFAAERKFWTGDSLIVATPNPALVFTAPVETNQGYEVQLLGHGTDKLSEEHELQFLYQTENGPFFFTTSFIK